MFVLRTEADSPSDAFHPVMMRGMDNSIIFQNGQTKARSPGRPGKSIVEDKEGEKVVGSENKDNAPKASTSRSPYFPPKPYQ